MRGTSPAWPSIAAATLIFWCSGQAGAQDPMPEALATPQGMIPGLPPLPGQANGAGSPGSPYPYGGAAGQPGMGGSGLGTDGFGAAGGGASSGAFGPGAGAGAGAGASTGAGGGGDPTGASPGLGGFAGGSSAPPGIIGDIAPTVSIRAVPGLPQPPPIPPPNNPSAPTVPNPKFRSQLAPSVRGFKIADNQSPFPQDRVFYSFNYFNDVNAKLNRYFASPIQQLGVYRHIFGFEKTFNEGKGSIGLRMPLNTIHAVDSPGVSNQGGQSTALGNVTIFAKYILEYSPKTGNLVTVGLAITPPTGPGHFGGARFLGGGVNNTTIQPFLGYYINLTPKLFLQGFSALDVPVNQSDVTLLYNDLALGYFLYRNPDEVITAIVPTLEVHVNTPLNHRAAYSLRDPSGTADSVNITSGMNVEIRRNSLFTLGVVVPTTGPRPFNVEAVALFNYRFGTPRRIRPTPIIGG